MGYEYVYALTPVREVEPNWWKLRWRPIRHRGIDREGTWSIHTSRRYRNYRPIGLRISKSGAHNGWGRSWDSWEIEISLWWVTVTAWVKYNIIVHKDGPLDVSDEKRRPLNLREAVHASQT